MSNLLHLSHWHLPGRLSGPALARIGATIYVGAVANWVILSPLAATSGFGPQFYYQVLAFAVPLAVAIVPVYRWLTGRPALARAVTLGALAGLAVLTPAAVIIPCWWKILPLLGEGLLTAIAAAVALIRLRAGADPDHAGRIVGGSGAFGVATIIISRAFGVETPDLRGILLQELPLLLAAAAVFWLPTPALAHQTAADKRPDFRWTAAACLMACAVALTASAAYNSGGGRWSDAFCVAGFILSGVLLDTERLTIAIGAAATAAVLAALSSQPSAGAISGLAQGLVQPLPWYIVMVQLRRDIWALILAAAEAVVWACWNMWDTTRQADAALMAAMVSLLALSIVGTFVPKRAGPEAQLGSRPMSTAEPPLAAREEEPAEGAPPATVADALKRMYGDWLTPRELQVGQMVVLGVSSKDIAAQLYLSESTVKTHLKSVYRKTETANRNDLYRRLVASLNEDLPEPMVANRLTAALMAAPKDPVTELLGRQSFDRVANERILVDQVNHRPTALLYVALRMENRGADRQGQAMAVVAGILRASLRTMDLLFRYGEYEFIVLLPGSDGAGAHLAGERLAHRIRSWASGRPSPLEVKMGWASTGEGISTLPALLAHALERAASQ